MAAAVQRLVHQAKPVVQVADNLVAIIVLELLPVAVQPIKVLQAALGLLAKVTAVVAAVLALSVRMVLLATVAPVLVHQFQGQQQGAPVVAAVLAVVRAVVQMVAEIKTQLARPTLVAAVAVVLLLGLVVHLAVPA